MTIFTPDSSITWFVCSGNFGTIRRLRRIAALGMPEASKAFYRDAYRTPEFLLEISAGQWHFPDTKVFEHEFRDQLGQQSSIQGVTQGQNSVDAASLVFGHSILDYCVNECCRITASAGLEDWEPRVLRKQVALSEIKDRDYGTLLQEKIDAEVEEQTRRTSLAKRIDLLNQICQPVPGFDFEKQPYRYEGKRIEQIDARRHQIVHHVALEAPFDSVEDDIRYLEATMSYVVNLVSHKYRLPIDLKVWLNHVQSKAKAG